MITLQEKMSYHFKDKTLLVRALTHKSYFNENEEQSTGHNERLEFLGDAVLDLSMSHLLMLKFPQLEEGQLSKLRASLVNESTFAEMASELNLQNQLKLGKGEANSGGREKPRLLASVFEAVIGALYLDAGFGEAHEFIERTFASRINEVDLEHLFAKDYKTRLQEITQEKRRQTPSYEVIGEEGPDHKKSFIVKVSLAGEELALGKGYSKKQAEQSAAEQALEKANEL